MSEFVDGDHSQAELEHLHRARKLARMFNQESLAEFLHQQYRAASKAIARQYGRALTPLQHDHGWRDCYGKTKKYFLRRAEWLLTDYPAYNGRIKAKS